MTAQPCCHPVAAASTTGSQGRQARTWSTSGRLARRRSRSRLVRLRESLSRARHPLSHEAAAALPHCPVDVSASTTGSQGRQALLRHPHDAQLVHARSRTLRCTESRAYEPAQRRCGRLFLLQVGARTTGSQAPQALDARADDANLFGNGARQCLRAPCRCTRRRAYSPPTDQRQQPRQPAATLLRARARVLVFFSGGMCRACQPGAVVSQILKGWSMLNSTTSSRVALALRTECKERLFGRRSQSTRRWSCC